MARQTDIRIRRSAVSGAIPLPANLNLGELALNTADGKAYMKKSIGGVDTVIEIGSSDPGSIYSSFEMFEYTAQVANQTTFSGADQNSNTLDYNTGSGTNLPQVQVYLNGILLDYGTDFTATNGSSVVFSVAVSAGDLIQIAAYKSNVTVTADLDLADNQKILLGDDDDLEIYHDGLKSIINDTGTGNLQFQIGGTEIFESTSDGIVLADGLDVEATEFIGDLRGSVLFKAQAGEALSKGDVVTITGISGNTTVVSKADADDASLMPAFGVAAETVSINAPVDIYSFGIMSNLTTNINGWTEGSPLYVSTIPGEMTDVPPSGSASLVQQIAKITKVHPSTGSIDITGAGRANATPNLDEGKIFVGNSSNRSVQVDDTIHVDMANSRVGINTAAPSTPLHVVGGTDSYVAKFEHSPPATGYAPGSILLEANGAHSRGQGIFHYNTVADDSWFTGVPYNVQSTKWVVAHKADTTFNPDVAQVSHAILTIDSATDNVGIGTSSPTAKLHVKDGDVLIQGGVNTTTVSELGFTNAFDTAFIKSKYTNPSVTTETYMAFHTNTSGATNGTVAEQMRIAGNKVGIGTTSPAQKLHVIGSGRFRSAASGLGSFIAVGNQTETAGNYSAYYFGNTSNDTGYFKGGIAYETLSTTHGRGDMHFLQRSDAGGGNADISHSVMTILNSGSVGIGTRTPDGLLHVQHTSVNSPIIVANRYNDTSTGTDFRPIFAVSEADLFSTGSTATIIGNHNRTIHLGSLYGVDGTASANSNCLTILAGGNVGIGTDSPSQKLHIADSGNAVVLIEAGNTSGSYVNFADTDDTNVGQIQYDHSSNFMAFRTNNSERMRIDLLGNLFVGSTFYAGNSASATGSGLSDGYLWSTRQANTAAIFNRLSTDGDIVQLRKDGTTVGSIGTANNDLVIGTGDVGFRFRDGSNDILPFDVGSNSATDGVVSFGAASNRFKDLYLSGTANVGPVISTVVNSGDATLLTLHHDTGADLAQQKSFIDFSFEDDNSNETPQVRIGAEVGQNNNADTQEKEGSGAFVVYTNNADTTAGAAGTSLAERMRVDYQGNVGIGTTNPTNHINTGSFFKPDSNGKFLTVNGGANGSFIMLESQTTTDNDQIGGIYWNRTGAQGDAHKQVAGIDVVQAPYAPNNLLEGGTLRFFTKGSGAGVNTPRMVIKDVGNVGIGTDSPTHKLQVSGTTYITNGFGDPSVEAAYRLKFYDNGGTYNDAGIGLDGSGGGENMWFNALNGFYWNFGTNGKKMVLLANGNLGIGVTVPKASFQVEEYGVDTTVTSTAAITQVAIHTFPIADFRSAKCTIQVTNTTDSTYHITEMLMIHNGTTVSITEYGTVYTGSTAEATFDADISSTNLRLLATPATTDGMTFKVVCHSITV